MTNKYELVEISTLTYGGDGMGRLPDGRAIFVPLCLPGEKIRVQVFEEKKGYARGKMLEILQPSPERVTARCKHFGVCGGCHYQDLDYTRQLEVKKQILQDQMERISGFRDLTIHSTVPATDPWNYRNSIQFHLSPTGKLGYQMMSSHQVVEISECHLPYLPIMNVWEQLEIEAMPGIERVSLRQGSDEEIMLILEGNGLTPPAFEVEMPLSAVYLSPEQEFVLAGDNYLTMQIMDRNFSVSASSFFQVNADVAEKMIAYLTEKLPLTPDATLMDVYCGVGLFSAIFAARVKGVIGVESSPSACQDFVLNLDEFENVELYEGLAEDVLPGLKDKAEIVIVDPPRAGIERAALDALIEMKPSTIAYVSCDPSTLARDAKRLVTGGYQLLEITPFDMFPQTYHIESISLFQKG